MPGATRRVDTPQAAQPFLDSEAVYLRERPSMKHWPAHGGALSDLARGAFYPVGTIVTTFYTFMPSSGLCRASLTGRGSCGGIARVLPFAASA